MTRTNAHSLLTVGLRLVAAYFLVTTMAGVVGQFFFVQPDAVALARPIWVVQSLSCVLFGALWLFADHVAGWGLASRHAPVLESEIDPEQWLAIGIALIGVWMVVDNFASLGYFAALKWSFSQRETYEGTLEFAAQHRAEVFSCSIQFVLGLCMSIGARGMARLIHSLRFAGARQEDQRRWASAPASAADAPVQDAEVPASKPGGESA